MSIRGRFENAVINEAELDPEKRDQHIQNANVNSHQDYFANKKTRRISGGIAQGVSDNPEEGYRVAGTQEENSILLGTDVKGARQNLRRGGMMKDFVTAALAERVQEPTGWQVMNLSMKDWMKMHEEYVQAEKVGKQDNLPFVPMSVYAQKILFKSNGAKRDKPLRPFLAGEMGQFISGPHEGKIICIKEKSPDDDGRRYAQVPKSFAERLRDLEASPPLNEKQQEEAGNLAGEDPIDSILESVSK